MSGNTFGTLFTVSTAGESHGPGLVAVVDDLARIFVLLQVAVISRLAP